MQAASVCEVAGEEVPAGQAIGAPPGQKKPGAHGTVLPVLAPRGQKTPGPQGEHVLALPTGIHEPVASRDMVCCSAGPQKPAAHDHA